MKDPLRRPEEILAYRPLRQIIAAKSQSLWTARPGDSALSAMHLMADKNIGLVLITEGNAIAGVLSERDCVRRIVLAGKSADVTPIADVMVRNVVTVDLSGTFADCLKLMHEHRIRHLPVTDKDVVVAVISIRDLLSEAIAHHARTIGELQRERLSMTISTA